MNSSQTFSSQTDPWQQLHGQCAPEVLCAPKTWGDPFSSTQMAPPENVQATVGYVLRNLVGRPWNNHLVLLVAVLYSQNIQYRTIVAYLSTLHPGFSELFAVLDLKDMTQWQVDTHLTQYLSGQVLPAHTATQRVVFWKQYQAASRHLKRWLSQLPDAQQQQYRPYVLPYPDDSHELTRLSGNRQVEYDRQEKRKAETASLMPFYADLRTHAHLRYNLLLRLRKAYHKAIKAVEQGKAALPFEFELREGGSERQNHPATERLVFKLWDRRTFVLAHADDTPPSFSQETIRKAQNRIESFSREQNSYLLEFVRAEALDGSGPDVGLWFVDLLEREVVGKIVNGPREVVEAKRAWLRAQSYGEDEDELIQPFLTVSPGVLRSTQASGDSAFIQSAKERTGSTSSQLNPSMSQPPLGWWRCTFLRPTG
jgi:hypothetical protein